MNNTIEYCDLKSSNLKWNCLIELPHACMAPAIDIHDGKIYIVGGFEFHSEYERSLRIRSDVLVYDLSRNRYVLIPCFL